MYKCSLCEKLYKQKKDLELSRSPENKWVMLCQECKNKQQNKSAKKIASAKNKSVSKPTFIQNKIKNVLRKTQDSFSEIKKNLADLKEQNNLLDVKSIQGPKRIYERQQVNMEMQFSYLRDQKIYKAKIYDISKGGICFQTNNKLAAGQTIRAVVYTPEQVNNTNKIENFIEIIRVTLLEDNLFQVGARFVKRISVDDSNRRINKRRNTSCAVFYKRPKSVLTLMAKSLDISQGGMRLLTNESLKVGEILEIKLRTKPPAFVHADLKGFLETIRVKQKNETHYEVGGKFAQLKVIPVSNI